MGMGGALLSPSSSIRPRLHRYDDNKATSLYKRLDHKVNHVPISFISTNLSLNKTSHAITGNGICNKSCLLIQAKVSTEGDFSLEESTVIDYKDGVRFVGVHHVGLLCQNLETSLDFYQNLLGLKINEARPHGKLPFRGAWLWVGSEMIHLMELPNPDPLTGRPDHGGRDRHACVAVQDVSKLKAIFDKAGVSYTYSRSGRQAIFARDPDGNALEFVQVD